MTQKAALRGKRVVWLPYGEHQIGLNQSGPITCYGCACSRATGGAPCRAPKRGCEINDSLILRGHVSNATEHRPGTQESFVPQQISQRLQQTPVSPCS